VDTKVDCQTITVGDPITYTLTITGDASDQIQVPALGTALERFAIRDYHEEGPTKNEQGQQVYRATYVITLYETGDFEIPSMEVKWTPAGGKEQTITTEPLRIQVKSVYTSDAADLRGAKPPALIDKDPRQAIRLGAFGGGGMVLLVGLLWLRRWLRQRGRPVEVVTEPPRPAHEVALEALDRLAESDLFREGRGREFHFELSDILRRYLESRFGVAAMERPTGLLIPELQAAQVSPEHVTRTEDFLVACDLAKFAKYQPSPAETAANLDTARRIVLDTMASVVEEVKEEETEDRAEG
jgi:hypothetical protein